MASGHPEAALATARHALTRLLKRDMAEPVGSPRSFAVLPFDATLDARAVAKRLAPALRAYGRVLVIDAALGQGRPSEWFDARERSTGSCCTWPMPATAPGAPPACANAIMLVAAGAEAAAWPDSSCHSARDALHRPRHLLLGATARCTWMAR